MKINTKVALVAANVIYDDTDAAYKAFELLFHEREKPFLSFDSFRARRPYLDWNDYRNMGMDCSVRTLQGEFLERFDDRECSLTPSIAETLESLNQKGVQCVVFGMQSENQLASMLASFGICSHVNRIVGDIRGTTEEVAQKIQWTCDSMSVPCSPRYASVLCRTAESALSADMVCAQPFVFLPDFEPVFGWRYAHVRSLSEIPNVFK